MNSYINEVRVAVCREKVYGSVVRSSVNCMTAKKISALLMIAKIFIPVSSKINLVGVVLFCDKILYLQICKKLLLWMLLLLLLLLL